MARRKKPIFAFLVACVAGCAASQVNFDSKRSEINRAVCSADDVSTLKNILTKMGVQYFENTKERTVRAILNLDQDQFVTQSAAITAEYDQSNRVTKCDVQLVATGP